MSKGVIRGSISLKRREVKESKEKSTIKKDSLPKTPEEALMCFSKAKKRV